MNRVKSFARVWSSREEAAFAKRSSRRRIAAPAHSSTNAGDDALSKPRSAAYTGVLTGSSSTHSSRKRVAGSVSAGKSLASRPARFRVISGTPSQWMIASRISLSSRSAALTGGGRNPPPRPPRWWPPSCRFNREGENENVSAEGFSEGFGEGVDRALSTLVRRPEGSAGTSARRDLAIDAARRGTPRLRGVSNHAPRVCGVCRPCDRRPFRRGVTRRHRRRRRELTNARHESRLFPATHTCLTRSCAPRARNRLPNRTSRARRVQRGRTRSAQTRARGAHAALRPTPTNAWGCGRACWWRSAWRRRRYASRRARGRDARGRDPRPRARDPPRKRHPTRLHPTHTRHARSDTPTASSAHHRPGQLR